jgi:hypothetical protein
MKNLLQLTLSFLLLITVVSCKKEASVSSLNGTWELKSMIGGQPTTSPNTEKHVSQLRFADQRFEKYDDGKLTDSGSYTITAEKKEINNNQANYYLTTHGDHKQYIRLSKSELVVFEGVIAADGVELYYTKLK